MADEKTPPAAHDMNEVLRRMLATPPKPHPKAAPKKKKSKKRAK